MYSFVSSKFKPNLAISSFVKSLIERAKVAIATWPWLVVPNNLENPSVFCCIRSTNCRSGILAAWAAALISTMFWPKSAPCFASVLKFAVVKSNDSATF